ncbi:hypothetical protein [uncultured Sphingomonas sp.]|uniref:hypothetical protein n=1 Tax=uncultured Sphingomonas sp. TaxID=158754 RepID=UPI0025EC469B|nr:hypothetical protein [uncultured Sphingomonas sp.]
MTVFGGLFGHDKKSARATGAYADLPQAPPVPNGTGLTGNLATGLRVPGADQPTFQHQKLPTPPPILKRRGAFDDEHYQQTMMALAAAFFGSNGLGEGLSNAAKTIYSQNDGLRKAERPQLGGPDDAFEVYTDPETGEHTYKPIQAAVDYLQDKRTKAKDVLDANGRVMFSINKLPPAQREAAFQEVRSNPDVYGVHAPSLPEHWSDTYGTIAGTSGMTVSQAMSHDQAATNEVNRDRHRDLADADRTVRTSITAGRASAATRQADERIALAVKSGARADRSQNRQDLKAGVVGGYQYRRDPVTGKLQRRKVQ